MMTGNHAYSWRLFSLGMVVSLFLPRPRPGRRGLYEEGWLGDQDSNLGDRKSTRLNSSHLVISYAVFCLKKKNAILHATPIFLRTAIPGIRPVSVLAAPIACLL